MATAPQKSSKGTAIDSAQAVIAAEIQKHLPNADSVGTFFYGKRLTTPTGRVIPPSRPSSAVAARARGVSVGAEEKRPLWDTMNERMSVCRPPRSILSDVEIFLVSTQRLLRKECDRKALTISGAEGPILSLLAPHSLRHTWIQDFLQNSKGRWTYPVVAAASEDIAQRGPLDRIATILHAIGQYKLLIEQDKVPSATISVKEQVSRMTAETAKDLFGHAFRTQPGGGGDTLCGSDFSARSVTLVIGSNFFELDIISPGGRVLFASEIKQRIVAAIQATTERSHAHPYLAKLHRMSCATNPKSWSQVVADLSSTCTSNQLVMHALDRNLLTVTLMTSGEAERTNVTEPVLFPLDDSEGGESAVWSGSGLHLSMYPSGVCVFRASGLLVDVTTLTLFAQWVSQAANTDPMLSPPPATSEKTVVAVKRVAPSSVRPSTGQQQKGKNTQVDAELTLEETSSVVNVVLPTAELSLLAKAPSPLPLWIPFHRQEIINSSDIKNPYTVVTFTVDGDAALAERYGDSLLHLAVVHACEERLRTSSDTLPPLVRCAHSSAVSCPEESLLFSPEIEAALKLLSAFELHHAASVEQGKRHVSSSEMRDAIRVALESAGELQPSGWATMNVKAPVKREWSSLQGALIPMARALSKGGYLPGRPTLRGRGEACAASDITICRAAPVAPSELGLLWIAECNLVGVADSRLSLSYAITSAKGWVCTLVGRNCDADVIRDMCSQIQQSCRLITHVVHGQPL